MTITRTGRCCCRDSSARSLASKSNHYYCVGFATVVLCLLSLGIDQAQATPLAFPSPSPDNSNPNNNHHSHLLLGPCREQWNFLLSASCSHCQFSGLSSAPPNPLHHQHSHRHCQFLWTMAPRCAVLDSSAAVCTVPVQNAHHIAHPESSNDYGGLLMTSCHVAIEACVQDGECVRDYATFVDQAEAGGFANPDAYCSARQSPCSALFLQLIECAMNVAPKVGCASDLDCPGVSHFCDLSSGRCAPVACCSDLSYPECCGCQFGGLTAIEFCSMFCANAGDDSTSSGSVSVPSACCQACAGGDPSEKYAPEDSWTSDEHAKKTLSNADDNEEQLLQQEKCAKAIGCQDASGWHNLNDVWHVGCTTNVCGPCGVISTSTTVCSQPDCPENFLVSDPELCCPTCQGCPDNSGTWHRINETWVTNCTQYVCASCRNITSGPVPCPPSTCPAHLQSSSPSQCCPSCQGCQDSEGNWHRLGESWQVGCNIWTCEAEGVISVTPVSCAAPLCPPEIQTQGAEECCPTCVGCQDESGEWYNIGDTWTIDCIVYVCQSNGSIIHYPIDIVSSCPAVDCDEEFHYTNATAGLCCPECRGCQDQTGQWHHYGDSWQVGCNIQTCEADGTITVTPVPCAAPLCPEVFQTQATTECCPACAGCQDTNGEWHNFGDNWTIGCLTYTCEADGSVTNTTASCPTLSCCAEFQYTPTGACCPVCKGCKDSQNHYHHQGDSWTKHCLVYQCMTNGSISSTHVPCESPCCPEEFQAIPAGECCTECQGCLDTSGHWHHYGTTWTVGCYKYKCETSGNVTVIPPPCPTPGCPAEFQSIPTGRCCPSCQGCQDNEGNWYHAGDTWQVGCNVLTCESDNTISSTPVTCGTPLCPDEFQVVPAGSCCSACQGCQDATGEWHNVGDTWTIGCTAYVCEGNSTIISSPTTPCQALPCPSDFQVIRDGNCCPVCEGCRDKKNQWHHVNSTWTKNCRVYTCSPGGKINSTRVVCPVLDCPTDCHTSHPGECCPKCQGCIDTNGMWHRYGETWTYGCNVFICQPNGTVSTTPVPCYDNLDCPTDMQVTPPGQCCPSCQGCKDANGTWHNTGTTWVEGCNLYTCESNGTVTSSHPCVPLSCPSDFQTTLPDACCPICQGCQDNEGNWHHSGDTWQVGCNVLTCESDDTITSTPVTCGTPLCPEEFQIVPAGSCCSACQGCQDITGEWHNVGDTWTIGCITYVCEDNSTVTSTNTCPSPSASSPPSASPSTLPPPSESSVPSPSSIVLPSASPSSAPSPSSIVLPSASPSSAPSPSSIVLPSASSSSAPSPSSIVLPSASPSSAPSPSSIVLPSASPSSAPSPSSIVLPSASSSPVPSSAPSASSIVIPSASPSTAPSASSVAHSMSCSTYPSPSASAYPSPLPPSASPAASPSASRVPHPTPSCSLVFITPSRSHVPTPAVSYQVPTPSCSPAASKYVYPSPSSMYNWR